MYVHQDGRQLSLAPTGRHKLTQLLLLLLQNSEREAEKKQAKAEQLEKKMEEMEKAMVEMEQRCVHAVNPCVIRTLR